MYVHVHPSYGMVTERLSARLRGSAMWTNSPAHEVGRSARHPERFRGCGASQASFSSGMSVKRKANVCVSATIVTFDAFCHQTEPKPTCITSTEHVCCLSTRFWTGNMAACQVFFLVET